MVHTLICCIQGAKYKFGVPVDSEGFETAHPVVLYILHRLKWAAQMVISEAKRLTLDAGQATYGDISDPAGVFNELLALGFMEEDSINVRRSCPLPTTCH